MIFLNFSAIFPSFPTFHSVRPRSGIYKLDNCVLYNNNIIMCFAYRYDVMNDCWNKEPEERPTFTELVSTLSLMMVSEAGYLALSPRSDNSLRMI